ncbi:TPA_asm: maturation protein [ssRNA phage Gerhypos.4_34]|uniref:Maturation protein n=2 Tax=Fiersviridae TaxID=2842319 RepID=A0A8S5KYT7_9VIRU|nr:maturation protein [ssRNA phage Gerhypos.4_34]QDH88690.1 MAG: hypothetical protein H4Bulk46632_000001 [Leviviridae sp.]DAD50311.1 TPA_asm: maturation protein [ssRNA phage Gerhypos.4_34]
MTTPAIDIDMRQYVDGVEHLVRWDGSTDTSHSPNCLVRQAQQSRPASISNRKSESGWRSPSAWRHSTLFVTPQPISADFAQHFPVPGERDSVITYSLGAGWDGSYDGYPDLLSGVEDKLIIKALTKLKNQKVNYAQNFAEREQAVKLCVSTLRRIAKTVDAFKSKNPKKLWDSIKGNEGKRGYVVPQSWLEVQYGWSPLMSDVHSACQQIADREKDAKANRATVVAGYKTGQSRGFQKPSKITRLFGISGISEYSAQCKIRLDYVLDSPVIQSLSQAGITNPLSIAWELAPYSFVVDWFVPVGAYLNVLDAALAWNFLGGSYSTTQRLKQTGSGWFGAGASINGDSFCLPVGDPYFSLQRMDHSRKVYGTSPLPRFPGIKKPGSTGHIANAFALLVAALR